MCLHALAASAELVLMDELTGLLKTHPQIQAAEKSRAAQNKAVDRAESKFWPTVSATGDAGPEYVSNPTTRTDAQLDREWRRTRNVAGVTVSKNLFDGGVVASAVKSARLNHEVADLTLEATRQATLFEGTNAYINVLRQRRLIQLSRQAEDNVQKQLQLEDERVQRGSGVAVDVLEAKRRLQTAKERRVTYEGALADAVSKYNQIFAHSPDVEAMVDPTPPIELLPSDLDKAIEIALRENPAVDNAAVAVEVAREAREVVDAQYLPTIDLVGKANYEKHKNATLGTRRDYFVGVQATWDMFTGFSTQHAASQAAFSYGASKDTALHMGRKVTEQTRLAWQALLTARERVQLLENAVNIAHEVWISRQKLRESGKETVINVLDAENEVSNAQINYTAAAYDERVAVFQVLLAMGRLSPRFLGIVE
ncbi:MAG: TolC family outer membrane protein [Magnetospirillum sp. WYHS-4]